MFEHGKNAGSEPFLRWSVLASMHSKTGQVTKVVT